MTERPDLTATATKLDVLVRLTAWHRRLCDPDARMTAYDFSVLLTDIGDAADAISGLRETCERRLAMINDLKRELADARVEEGR